MESTRSAASRLRQFYAPAVRQCIGHGDGCTVCAVLYAEVLQRLYFVVFGDFRFNDAVLIIDRRSFDRNSVTVAFRFRYQIAQ